MYVKYLSRLVYWLNRRCGDPECYVFPSQDALDFYENTDEFFPLKSRSSIGVIAKKIGTTKDMYLAMSVLQMTLQLTAIALEQVVHYYNRIR